MAVGREPCCHCEAFASQKSYLVGEKGLKGAGVEKPSPHLLFLRTGFRGCEFLWTRRVTSWGPGIETASL